MTTTTEDEVLCITCEQPKSMHGDGPTQFKHPFTTPSQPEWVPPKSKEKTKPNAPAGNRGQVLVAPMPDLVLRHALVKAGILTSQQLEEAEHDLRVGGGNAHQVPPDQANS